MASGRIHKAMVYLGLSDDDDYDEYEEYEEPAPAPAPAQQPRRTVADPMESDSGQLAGVRTLPRESVAARDHGSAGREQTAPAREYTSPSRESTSSSREYTSSGRDYSGPHAVVPRSAVVRPITASPNARVHVVAPGQFADSPQVADRLKSGQPVIVNLQGADRDLSRRIVDFCSGVTYALGGGMDKVADLVFLLTPTNVEVSAEEKRRLEERGYRS